MPQLQSRQDDGDNCDIFHFSMAEGGGDIALKAGGLCPKPGQLLSLHQCPHVQQLGC